MIQTYNAMQSNDEEINAPQKMWDVLEACEDHSFAEKQWK